MPNQLLQNAQACNPRNSEEARALVRHVESLFMPWNIEALVDGFTEDCVVRFGSVAQFTGRDALRQFFLARSVRQKGYRLNKHFRSLSNDVMTNVWEGRWEDATSGRSMIGFGVELWTLRNGKIAIWEAAFNAAPADQSSDLDKMLS
jgi:nuclear transport factor 2 (NTF2) superfamily protein